MTDRDKSSEGFLQRWSRRKGEAERETPAATEEKRGSSSEQASASAQTPSPQPPKPEFDLSSLPSLDQITATTDIRAFLMPGVPKELARAALRRAWAADPAIRDFVGLAENAWDFTDPTAMAGFGELPPGLDVKKLVAEIFGEKEQPQSVSDAVARSPEPQQSDPMEETSMPSPPGSGAAALQQPDAAAPTEPPEPQSVRMETTQIDFVQRANNIASQQSHPDDDLEERSQRRQHGGALPQ